MKGAVWFASWCGAFRISSLNCQASFEPNWGLLRYCAVAPLFAGAGSGADFCREFRWVFMNWLCMQSGSGPNQFVVAASAGSTFSSSSACCKGDGIPAYKITATTTTRQSPKRNKNETFPKGRGVTSTAMTKHFQKGGESQWRVIRVWRTESQQIR